MKPWRVGFSYLGLLLSLIFCLPVIVKETKSGSLDYTQNRLLIQLGIILADAAIGLLTVIVCFFRWECLMIINLLVLSLFLIPTLIEVGFAAVPVFTTWCCCFGPDLCLVADTRIRTITSSPDICPSCETYEFVGNPFTLFFVGSCLVLVSLVFLLSTACFWRSSFVKEENEADFFLARNRRMNNGKYVKQESLQGDARIVP